MRLPSGETSNGDEMKEVADAVQDRDAIHVKLVDFRSRSGLPPPGRTEPAARALEAVERTTAATIAALHVLHFGSSCLVKCIVGIVTGGPYGRKHITRAPSAGQEKS